VLAKADPSTQHLARSAEAAFNAPVSHSSSRRTRALEHAVSLCCSPRDSGVDGDMHGALNNLDTATGCDLVAPCVTATSADEETVEL
jgi:hypothetical protein